MRTVRCSRCDKVRMVYSLTGSPGRTTPGGSVIAPSPDRMIRVVGPFLGRLLDFSRSRFAGGPGRIFIGGGGPPPGGNIMDGPPGKPSGIIGPEKLGLRTGSFVNESRKR